MVQCVAVCCSVLLVSNVYDTSIVYICVRYEYRKCVRYEFRRSVYDTSIVSVLQCVAVCCSVLQCVAVCCSVLLVSNVYDTSIVSVLQCVAVCCSVLQCVVGVECVQYCGYRTHLQKYRS